MNCMKKKIFGTALAMFLLTSVIKAQEEFIEPPSRLLTRIPFTQLTGGVVILHALLDNFSDTEQRYFTGFHNCGRIEIAPGTF
jgi:hypothetical protein